CTTGAAALSITTAARLFHIELTVAAAESSGASPGEYGCLIHYPACAESRLAETRGISESCRRSWHSHSEQELALLGRQLATTAAVRARPGPERGEAAAAVR